MNNFKRRAATKVTKVYPDTLDHFRPSRSILGPAPYFPFEPERAKKWPKFPFILKKWFQVRGVRTPIPQISGAALVGRPKWWKKSILYLFIIGILFEKKKENEILFPVPPFFLIYFLNYLQFKICVVPMSYTLSRPLCLYSMPYICFLSPHINF